MKSLLTPLAFLLITSNLFPQAGDTIVVQTFTYGSPQNAWFEFPPDTGSLEKVLLYYKLKCNPNQNPACGEWDYLTYTYLYDHTGEYDSSLLSHPNYIVGGASPPSFAYSNSPTYTYTPRWEYNIVYDDTLSWNDGTVGLGSGSSAYPFDAGGGGPQRMQMLWRASELSAAGIIAGDITGMAFDLLTLSNAEMYGLHIGMKHTLRDSVSEQFEEGLISVYEHGTSFPDTGWQSLAFTTPFNWDGTSNILIEICFDADLNSPSYWVATDYYPWSTMIETAAWDWYFHFNGPDRVDMDPTIFDDIDSFVTISLWQFGDPNIQPQDNMTFEAFDSNDQRQVNVHLPWSNSRVYWDCGNNGSGYDRIDKAAAASEFEGKWNHWTFTKDVAAGIMQIYLNGKLWHSGTGKTKTISDVAKFVLGASATNSNNYDGFIDELYIWDTVIDTATDRQWMYRSFSGSHPFASSLVAYFDFSNAWFTVPDQVGNHDGMSSGLPQRKQIRGCEQFRDAHKRTERPQVRFEQGTFLSHLDSVIVIDSAVNELQQVIIFGDALNPTVATDTLYVWPAAFRNTYDNSGNVISSTWIADDTLYLQLYYYYSSPFEVVVPYEIFRYITPYGIGLNLSSQGDGEGFTWIFDVTDFEPLLHDSVQLSAGNWQELLDMKFVMIKGTPPREVKEIRNVYSGGHGYNAAIETNFLYPKKFYIAPDVASARLRINNTGHGFGGNLNCSEFCPRDNNIFINGSLAFLQYLWRGDCDLNPVYPQGGTWIYDRANWCPGAEVDPSIHELTPHISPGDSITIDYNMQSGYVWNGQGSGPYYQIESQLVTYGANNFTLDASIEDIIAPNKYEGYKRWNPRCNGVIVKIKNTGTQGLTSLNIEYGPKGGTKSTYAWTGTLTFLEEVTVNLPAADWGSWVGSPVFEVTLSSPNGAQDEYARNNYLSVPFKSTPQYASDFFIQFQTNSAGYENSYKLFDGAGTVVFQRTGMTSNTTYRDTFHLGTGCYRLVVYDSDEDGVSFFANSDGTGAIKLKEVGGTYFKTFEPNFGSEIAQSFTVGYTVGVEEQESIEVFSGYPNPNEGQFSVDVQLLSVQDVELMVIDALGNAVIHQTLTDFSLGTIQLDLTSHANGLYFVVLRSGDQTQVQKLIRQ